MSKQTNLSSGCLLPDEPVLCVVVGLLGAPLEDVVVEVGAVAAGDAQDVEGADLLHSCSFPRCISSPALRLRLRLLRSCASLVTLVLAEKTFDHVVMHPSFSSLNASVSHRRHSVSHQQG